jgi:hypothetical protein
LKVGEVDTLLINFLSLLALVPAVSLCVRLAQRQRRRRRVRIAFHREGCKWSK